MQGKAQKTPCTCHRVSIVSHNVLIKLVVFHWCSADLWEPQATLSSKTGISKKGMFVAALQQRPNVTLDMDLASPPKKESSKTGFCPNDRGQAAGWPYPFSQVLQILNLKHVNSKDCGIIQTSAFLPEKAWVTAAFVMTTRCWVKPVQLI